MLLINSILRYVLYSINGGGKSVHDMLMKDDVVFFLLPSRLSDLQKSMKAWAMMVKNP